MSDLSKIVRAGHEAFLQLAASIDQAEEIQWEAAPASRPRALDDGPRTTSSEVPNPTADIALDGRRLAVRAEVKENLTRLSRMADAALAATERVDLAVDRWYGDTPPPTRRP